jgi:chemotaxis protein CheZ
MAILRKLDDPVAAADQHTLFDSATQTPEGLPLCAAAAPNLRSSSVADATANEIARRHEVFQRVGHMARELRDVMRDLGYVQLLEQVARAIPDARERLRYIAQMTEQAANRVLNATDVARPIQERLASRAQVLGAEWEKRCPFGGGMEDFKLLGDETRDFLAEVPQSARATNEQLLEIMMAQDFQDLTGQVINKIIRMARSLEDQLLQLLVELTPEGLQRNVRGRPGELARSPHTGTEVLGDQVQVNELLEMLGF